MNDRLFCYGTLQFPEVLRAVTGSELPSEPARLGGYARYRVRGKVYPGVVAVEGSSTEGVVYSGITRAHLAQLDAFEGSLYERLSLPISLAEGDEVEAWVYIVSPAKAKHLSDEPWQPESFERGGLQGFLEASRDKQPAEMASEMAQAVRQARESDAASLAEIEVESSRAAYRDLLPAPVLEKLDLARYTDRWKTVLGVPDLPIYVFEEGGVSLAFAMVAAVSTDGADSAGPDSAGADNAPPAIAEITGMFVRPPHWRRGIGRCLLKRLMDEALRRGFHQLKLWVLADNHSARRFYESMGFHSDGVTQNIAVLPGQEVTELEYRLALNN